jgi:hypothetical protein
MTKKIPCKVIRSFSLSADGLSGPLQDFDFSNDMHIVNFHSTPGMFTYNMQLKKSFISYEKAPAAQILDYYV